MKEENNQRIKEYNKKFNVEKILKYILKENKPIIFDVGANVGNTIIEYKKYWPEAKIHAFEPQEECLKTLEVISDNFKGDICINNVAVGSDHNHILEFYTHDINSEISGFSKINLNSNDSIFLNKIKNEKSKSDIDDYEKTINHKKLVKTIRLDKYLEKNSIDKINLLKIDTQGYEKEVLDGLGSFLSKTDIVLTEIMFFDYYEKKLSFTDIEKYLLPAGFELYNISHISQNPMNGRTDWIDVIYVNKNLLK